MYWGERAQNIYRILDESGNNAIVESMIKEYGNGGTVGEQLCIVCIWLAKIKNHNNELFDLVKMDAELILQEGIDLKYFTNADYKKL